MIKCSLFEMKFSEKTQLPRNCEELSVNAFKLDLGDDDFFPRFISFYPGYTHMSSVTFFSNELVQIFYRANEVILLILTFHCVFQNKKSDCLNIYTSN